MAHHRYSKYLRPISLGIEIILLCLSIVLSLYYINNSVTIPFDQGTKYFLIVSLLSWPLLNILFKDNPTRSLRFAKVIRMTLGGLLLHLLLVITIVLFIQQIDISRTFILLTQLYFSVLIFIWRFLFFYSVRLYRKRGFNYRNIVVVGYGELSHELERYFRAHPEYGYKLLGFFDKRGHGKNILGEVKSLFSYCTKNPVDEIYCCLPYVRYSQIKEIIDFSDNNFIKVKLIADFRGFSLKGVELERYDYIPVLNVTSMPLDDRKSLLVKRFFDVIFSSLIILFIFSWLFPLVALAIKLDSKGPIFFKQKRTGRGNETFWCLKFRTMYVNGKSEIKQATKGDSRITKVGEFLRKTSIDELPQFFNVFNGSMSVVGPRPHMLRHTEEYSKVVEKFMVRHFVKPGITGLAQAKGYRGETKTVVSMKNRVKLDRFYIENWSIFLDLKIILLTILSLFKGDENAY